MSDYASVPAQSGEAPYRHGNFIERGLARVNVRFRAHSSTSLTKSIPKPTHEHHSKLQLTIYRNAFHYWLVAMDRNTRTPDLYANSVLGLLENGPDLPRQPDRRRAREQALRQQRIEQRRAARRQRRNQARAERQRNAQERLDNLTYDAVQAWHAHKRQEQTLKDDFTTATNHWKRQHPITFAAFDWHATQANNESDAPVRRCEVMLWFRRGLPTTVAQILEAAYAHYERELRLRLRINANLEAAGRSRCAEYELLQEERDALQLRDARRTGSAMTVRTILNKQLQSDVLPFSSEDLEAPDFLRWVYAMFSVRKVRVEHIVLTERYPYPNNVDTPVKEWLSKMVEHLKKAALDVEQRVLLTKVIKAIFRFRTELRKFVERWHTAQQSQVPVAPVPLAMVLSSN